MKDLELKSSLKASIGVPRGIDGLRLQGEIKREVVRDERPREL